MCGGTTGYAFEKRYAWTDFSAAFMLSTAGFPWPQAQTYEATIQRYNGFKKKKSLCNEHQVNAKPLALVL